MDYGEGGGGKSVAAEIARNALVGAWLDAVFFAVLLDYKIYILVTPTREVDK